MMTSNINQQKIVFVIEDDADDATTYYSNNKNAFKERYLNNLESKRSYQIDYNLINNEKYNEYQKKYYEQRRESLLETKKEKVKCECGKMVSAGHLTCHKKTSIHLRLMSLIK
jgi:hypothetical protein